MDENEIENSVLLALLPYTLYILRSLVSGTAEARLYTTRANIMENGAAGEAREEEGG